MDADLSSDDIKAVRYVIVFEKPDAETTLQAARIEIVAYSTNGSSFGGLILAKFLDHLGREGIPWPLAWTTRPSDAYPEVGQRIKEIPEEDRKYIDFIYEVISRQPKQDPALDKQQTKALRQIRDALE